MFNWYAKSLLTHQFLVLFESPFKEKTNSTNFISNRPYRLCFTWKWDQQIDMKVKKDVSTSLTCFWLFHAYLCLLDSNVYFICIGYWFLHELKSFLTDQLRMWMGLLKTFHLLMRTFDISGTDFGCHLKMLAVVTCFLQG